MFNRNNDVNVKEVEVTLQKKEAPGDKASELSELKGLPPALGYAEYFDGVSWYKLATETFVADSMYMAPSCAVATTGNLTATYVNGALGGIGATLTNSGALAAFATDGYTALLNDRILVKNQDVASQNGIYTVTVIGSVSSAWVLTRSSDYDLPVRIKRGSVVPIIGGSTLKQTLHMETSLVSTVGTDSILFTLINQNGIQNILGTANQINVSILNGVATVSIADNPILPGTGSVTIPTGSTAQRPSTGSLGMIRINTGS